jgi:hypothetical protein
MEMDFEPPLAVDHVRNSIVNLLAHSTWLPDFKEHRIPTIQRNPQVHQELTALLQQRNSVEQDLMNMLDDRAADGTPLNPKRDFEKDYERLNQQYDDLNRAMFECYLRFLDDKEVTRERKRKAETALSAVAITDTPPCSYTHIADLPVPPPSSPQWDPITLTETGNKALLMHGVHSQPGRYVTAIADSGASHVLIRASDAHILQSTEFSPSKTNPYAVLKAANHGYRTWHSGSA